MPAATQTLVLTQTVAVPPAEVYYAFTTAAAWEQWCCEVADVDARPGGRLYIYTPGYYASGEFTALEEGRVVAFTWDGKGEPPTHIQVALDASDGGTLVTFTVTGRGSDQAWADIAGLLERLWGRALRNLQAVLETGHDMFQPPVLGFVGGEELTPQIAAVVGVPVGQGFHAFDAIEGMGAHAAGLQRDDVLVEVGGRPITTLSSFGQAMSAYGIGDPVEVVFYRGHERKTATVVLSARPAPAMPPTAEATAAELHTIHDRLDAELAALFAGISEGQAGRPPAPGEWSAKQVLAHLISTERAACVWATLLTVGQHIHNWASNETCWVDAVANCYPTVPELLAALRQAEAETAAAVAALPVTFVGHKGTYTQLGLGVLQQMPTHTRMHTVQIRAALTAAGP